MNSPKSIMKAILGRCLRYTARVRLRKLRNTGNPPLAKIVSAVNGALRNTLSYDEKTWVEKIERMRSALNASSTQLLVIDYGAGTPSNTRTEEEMYEGKATSMTIASASKASKPYFWALLLFKLVREFKPSTCIELGTCLGVSAAYQAAALKINGKGRITTLEGADTLARLAEENLERLGLDNAVVVSGRFQNNLQRVLNANRPVDFAFIDGHHDEKATIRYFESFLPYLSQNSVVILDDIAWSDGMRRAWKHVADNQNVKVWVNLGAVGICVFDNEIESRSGVRVLLI